MLEIYNWIYAFRLKTLPLSLSGIILSSFISFSEKGIFNINILIWSSITSILLQILSNLANDYGDGIKNIDKKSCMISKKKMIIALIIFSILSFISHMILLYYSFKDHMILLYYSFKDQMIMIVIFIIGIFICIFSAIKYTIGNNPYGYIGLGDLSVLIFFGLISLEGNYYLYNHIFNYKLLLLCFSLGFLTVSVLNINNMRDIENDKKYGKYTIPVIIGLKNAKIYHTLLMIVPFILSIIYVFITYKSIYQYIFILLIIPTIMHLKNIYHNHDFNHELNIAIYINILYTLLMGIGFIL
ncbi:MAG: 1,4-dihydroxy-2-naphthoate octaprenyltransferase [Candidatus Sulcia muelleri]|uniref:1,4-dihydroxy-2-naphthoate octaprenyltransferase n=1 Tax=Karelsulcia muelleri (strain GWSS) TaxID=444179 RepID=A8Z5Z8_KARMG|nr:1,4-dihydroxy-2-naphthoate octaprenyltransferase [Candidatus Karelsulcia muelleri GWSS]MBS0018887.1 1,4-dihydroxy-2-naphthoate octaprenyltransferase [Candidatus Karelsulcia muelleri]MCJ7422421.1 1,4-dihydroxy-2-naphthoate octaprenyltransferase [Candidatus Karelsulcia muelleri]MCJ7468858.1 1,4-dihydroxy-2-naphthoate octaprenyltransferase [Candidatus Karelsulcia muelleri]